MPLFRRFRSMKKFLEFISKNDCRVAVDSFNRAKDVVFSVAVGQIGNFDQVVRINATPATSSRTYYHDMVVGIREGSSHGFADMEDRELVALSLTLTAADVVKRLHKRFGVNATLLFRGKPMPQQIKEKLRQQAEQFNANPMDYQLA